MRLDMVMWGAFVIDVPSGIAVLVTVVRTISDNWLQKSLASSP
jgi:hypothetical protein